MLENRCCERITDIPTKDTDFIIIGEQDGGMNYIAVPIVQAFDNFCEEYSDENGEFSEDITEDMFIDYIAKELLARGYTDKDFHVYKKVI